MMSQAAIVMKYSGYFESKSDWLMNMLSTNFSAVHGFQLLIYKPQNLCICYVSYQKVLNKEFVLLRRAISLKVNYEKVKFSNCVFCDNFSDYKLTYM